MTNLVSISNSEISTADRCMRKWYLQYYLGAVPADEPPVGPSPVGTRVHAALEGLYGYGMEPVTTIQVLYALAAEKFPEYRAELNAERELAEIMVSGYLDWTYDTGIDAGIEVVQTEADIEIPFPLVPGVRLKARMDQVIHDNNTGLLSFLDHKTAVNFETHEILALNPQFKFYSVVQRLIARETDSSVLVSGGMVNTLRRVKRTEKSKPPYYQRDTFRYTDTELDAAELRIASVAIRIMRARQMLDQAYATSRGDLDYVNLIQRSEVPPTPIPRQCKWDCPFVNVCPMMDDGSDWPGVLLRSGKYRQDDPYSYYREDPLALVRSHLGMSDPPANVG